MSSAKKNSTNSPLTNSPSSGLFEHPQHYIKDFDNAEDHYRDLIENASDIIYRTDLVGNFIYVNPVAARVMEYSVEELLQMNYLDLVTPDHREETENFYKNQLKEGIDSTYFEFKTETKSGKTVWFGQNVRIIKRDNEQIGFQAMARDITDRQTAQKQFKDNEEQLHLFVKHAPISVAMFDTEMNYIMASDLWMSEYNISHENVSGLNHYELFPELSEEWIENFSIGLSGVSQKTSEERVIDSNGEIKWIKWEIHPWYKGEKKVGGIIVYTEDITKRKQDEIALVQAREEAQQASAAKSNFIASMSHEFRTPLNAVLGFSEILGKEAALSAEHKDLLQQIYKSGTHLLSMINDVIELSRIETSRIAYDEVDFAVKGLLQSVAKPFIEKFKEKGLKFSAKIDRKVPKYIATDLEILNQILSQLISNAFKFTDAGSVVIAVDYKVLNPDATGRNGLFKIDIIDTGIGFKERDAEKIFRPFNKLNEQGYSGTGLGLTVVNRLCRFLGGQIGVESTPGKGSIFTLSIPVREIDKGNVEVETINFVSKPEADEKELLAGDVADFINLLPPEKKDKIIETLELQKLDDLIEIISSLDQDHNKQMADRLKSAARQYDFAFLKKVLEACKDNLS